MTRFRIPRLHLTPVLAIALFAAAAAVSADETPAAFATPSDAEDFTMQGEYTGRLMLDEGERLFGVQIVAGGGGQFDIGLFPGGLPGAGWNGDPKITTDGERTAATLTVSSGGTAELRDQQLHVRNADGEPIGKLTKVRRKSPTLGLPAPPHATMLFDGSNADAFEGGRMTDDGLLMQGAMSHEKFQDFRLHLEFRTPFMPAARSQQRGNSGVYMQGRYEVQILDSFGLAGRDNECGGIYGVKPPDLNMAFSPFTWQTYDVEFTAPRFDEQGNKTADARMTVRHNGVPVHKGVTIPGPTRASKVPEGPEPGPLYLQDHGNPVRFRNIWIVRKAPGKTGAG